MDGRSRYNKIKQLLEPIVGQTLHVEKIRKRIMIEIGTSDQVIYETMKLMIDLGMIAEVKAFVFKIITNEANI